MKTNALLSLTALIALSISALGQMTARVQAVHACPDPAAATVDVYLGTTRILDDFNYEEASPYIDAPAGTPITLAICAPTSTDTTNAIFRKTFTLMANNAYTVVASGGLAQSGSTAFDLRAYAGQEKASNMGMDEVSVNIIHSSYDAPMVDIYEVQVPVYELAPDVDFADQTGYTDLPAGDFDIQVRTQAGVVAAEFDVNVSAFKDSAITVMATGYLDPNSAVGTDPFGLIAIFPNGTVASLPTKSVTPARLQVIHNSAAADAAKVDVWLDATKLIPDFEFRTASAFIDAPAGQFFDVSIAAPNSMDTSMAIFKQNFILESARTYIVVASGNAGSGTYDPATPFTLEVITEAREMAMTSGNVDALVWHGSTDAPTVDVVETLQGAGTIVDDISYGEYQGYLDLAATDYGLEIRDETGTATVAKYYVDITALADQAITILASGYLDPSKNNSGPAFGLYAAVPAGGALIPLDAFTGIEENKSDITGLNIYPNPTVDILNITFEAQESGIQNIAVLDITGKVKISQQVNLNEGQNQIEVDVNNLPTGNYFVLMGENDYSSAIQFIKR